MQTAFHLRDGNLLPCLQMRRHIFDRPAQVQLWDGDLLFVQVRERFFPAFELFSQRGKDVAFHVHEWSPLQIVSSQF